MVALAITLSLFTGIALVFGYGLLGSTWLIYKTENKTKRHMQMIGKRFFTLTLFMILIVSLWTPYLHQNTLKNGLASLHIVCVACASVSCNINHLLLSRHNQK